MFEWIQKYAFDAGLFVVEKLGTVLDAFPHVPGDVVAAINSYIDLMFSYTSLISVFIDIDYVSKLIPWFIVVMYSDKALKGMNWVFSKCPIIGQYFQS